MIRKLSMARGFARFCARRRRKEPVLPMPVSRRLTSAQKKQVAARHRWTCARCKDLVDETYEVDHRVPLCDGGTDVADNLQLLCAQCHARKTYDEAIQRTLRRHQAEARQAERAGRTYATCTCNACGAVFSPYFRHACARR